MKMSSNFFVFIEVELNVGASSHVTRVQNTLRTDIESLIQFNHGSMKSAGKLGRICIIIF